MATDPRLSRRDLLRFGVVQIGGLGWGRPARSATASRPPGFGAANACILLFMDGAPSHLDLWDLKPDAPAEIRGPFRPIATSVPGLRVCEHAPQIARVAHRLTQVRSVSHDESVHPPALYHALTGFRAPNTSLNPTKRDLLHPHLGTVVGALAPAASPVPRMVELPETMALDGPPMDGQDAGYLGPPFDPLRVRVALDTLAVARPELDLPPGVSAERMRTRRALRSSARREGGEGPASLDEFQSQALDVLADGGLARAFELDREPDRLRGRYGRHRHGQCVLLARRLVEAGVRFVVVNWGREPQDWADGVRNRVANNPWDTHRNHFPLLRDTLIPRADQALSALIEDLAARGLLDSTLVVWMGEFGRTPRISSFASRDHWPAAYTVVLGGGGTRGGQVFGRTDAIGASVIDAPVSPADVTATIFHALGIDPATTLRDRRGVSRPITLGRPLVGLFEG